MKAFKEICDKVYQEVERDMIMELNNVEHIKIDSFLPLNKTHPQALRKERNSIKLTQSECKTTIIALRYALANTQYANCQLKYELETKSALIAKQQKENLNLSTQIEEFKQSLQSADDQVKTELVNVKAENNKLKIALKSETTKNVEAKKKLATKDEEMKNLITKTNEAIEQARSEADFINKLNLSDLKVKPAEKRTVYEDFIFNTWKLVDETCNFYADADNGEFGFKTSRFVLLLFNVTYSYLFLEW